MVYPLPTDIGNFTTYATYFNTVTQGSFWTLVILGFAVTIFAFMAARSSQIPITFHATMFLTFIVSLPLFAMKLITPQITLLIFLLWGVAAWFHKTQQS